MDKLVRGQPIFDMVSGKKCTFIEYNTIQNNNKTYKIATLSTWKDNKTEQKVIIKRKMSEICRCDCSK